MILKMHLHILGVLMLQISFLKHFNLPAILEETLFLFHFYSKGMKDVEIYTMCQTN